MTPTEITALFSAISAAGSAIGVPIYLSRRKSLAAETAAQMLDSRAVAQIFKEERDGLLARITEMQRHYESQIESLKTESQRALARAEAQWRAQHEKDQVQIKQLQLEVNALYRRIYSGPTPHPDE